MNKFLQIAAVAALPAMISVEAFAQAAQQDVNISATVPAYCTIGGAANPAALNATVPVNAAGVVTTTAIPFTVSNVVCNTAADVLATSQSGGVKNAGTAPSGFTNIIDYTGTASFSGATSTVNTATVPAATAAEAGNVASTAGAASGTLTIGVTPQTPASPLIPGSYSDTLRVTITPQ